MTDGVVKSLGVGRFLDWRTLEAAGAAGGVLICWDKRALELLEWEEGQFSISCKFRTVENGVVWVFTGVYGPFTKKDRECLWDELGAVRGLWGDPWCVGGDFNVILAQGERSRQGRVTPAMRRFAQVMDDLELIDLPLQGGSFTWSGGLHNQARARLDRFLVSPRWLDQFSNVTQKRLSQPISNHFPITIEGGGKRRGPSPFRFENMWLKVEGFKDLLRSWWQGMSQVDYWDQVESERRLSEEEFSRKKEAKEGYAKWVKLEEIHWRQLSRELWLREGDKIRGGLNLNQISQQEADILELLFMEEEVHSALMDMNGDKAPGPDGFTGAFWKFCLEFVKEEVLANRIKNVIGRVISSDQNAFRMVLDEGNGENGLGTKWREWIWSCISTAKFSVLVNGEPAGFFLSSKGLRQGDPLSPYLFIMGMEVLSALIRRAVEGGCITGCRIQRAASGLRINLAKSEIILVGEVDEILEMAVELGCKVGQLPSTYLGLPLGAPNKAGYVWDGVEEQMRWKLALWKRQYLSKGSGEKTRKIAKRFLVGRGKYGKKNTPSQLGEGVCEQEKGGLGLRKLVHLNKALLGKWVWRFARAKEEMWKRVLVAKYGQEEFGWRTKKANGAFGVLEGHLVWGCGAGPEIPSTLQCGCPKKCHCGGFMDQNAGQGGWNLRFIRSFNDWELTLVDELLQILRSQRITLEEDLAYGRGGKMGSFDVKDAYGLLTSHSTPLFPKKGIWVENVPSKLAFFAWEATWGRVLTIDRLQKRGWQIPNRCYLCGSDEENVNHLLIHCIVASVLWGMVLSLFGAQWVFPETVKEVIISWKGSFVGKKRKRIWRSIRYLFFGRCGRKGID
ncbi:putative mitochondrial protein [Vitis vinifera]|uniref:Putative mitochondrial protein n=1 Tax=Vitis vinifera TaxID=29760 RepID=A0A438BU42_VITVI|nr:putative mitochondrial protein [Vitis vinifera]